jgi:hypothetical protein
MIKIIGTIKIEKEKCEDENIFSPNFTLTTSFSLFCISVTDHLICIS